MSANEERKDCYTCYKDKQAKMRSDASLTAAESAKSTGLPALTGSEKQIAWAETIRKEHYDILIPLKLHGV